MTTLRRRLDDPKRSFWPLVGLILLVGLVLRVLVHDFGLPWFEEVDELRIWFTARIARDMPVVTGPKYDPDIYPPLIIWLQRLAQLLGEAQGRPLSIDAVLDLRRLMLLFNTLGGVWFAMLGRRCGGPPAGIIAAALWAFSADVLEVMIYAISESVVIPLLVLVALLAAQALDSARSWRWALASMGLGVLCFLGEFRLIVAVIPGFAALLWRAWRHYRPGWRLALLLCAAGLALAGVSGSLILARLPQRFQEIALETLGAYLWDFDAFFLFLDRSVGLLHTATLPLFLLLVLWALRARRSSPSEPLSFTALLVVVAFLVLTIWANSAIRPYGQDLQYHIWRRHLLPTTLMLYLLLATTVAQLLSAVQQTRTRRRMQAMLLAYLLLLLLPTTLRLVLDYRVPAWPVIVRNWVDDNLESSTILVHEYTERWFNPARSRMPQRVRFDWWRADDIREHSLDKLIETHKITWALFPAKIHEQQFGDDAEAQAFLDQMLLIREFRAPPQRRDNEALLYRLWRMQHETDLRFGEHIRLVGYDLHSPDPQPGTHSTGTGTHSTPTERGQAGTGTADLVAGTGDQLDLTLYWNASSTPPENYSFFLHLVAGDDPRPLAQVDGNPAVPARPTQTWDQPTETLISPRISLALPQDLAPGDYRVLLGLYNVGTGARLPARAASGTPPGDALELLQLSVDHDGRVTVRDSARAGR